MAAVSPKPTLGPMTVRRLRAFRAAVRGFFFLCHSVPTVSGLTVHTGFHKLEPCHVHLLLNRLVGKTARSFRTLMFSGSKIRYPMPRLLAQLRLLPPCLPLRGLASALVAGADCRVGTGRGICLGRSA